MNVEPAEALSLETIITIILAIYGALLTTYTIIMKRREHKREIKVFLQYGLSVTASPEKLVLIEAKNTGGKSVLLNSVGLILPKKENILFMTKKQFMFPRLILFARN